MLGSQRSSSYAFFFFFIFFCFVLFFLQWADSKRAGCEFAYQNLWLLDGNGNGNGNGNGGLMVRVKQVTKRRCYGIRGDGRWEEGAKEEEEKGEAPPGRLLTAEDVCVLVCVFVCVFVCVALALVLWGSS